MILSIEKWEENKNFDQTRYIIFATGQIQVCFLLKIYCNYDVMKGT